MCASRSGTGAAVTGTAVAGLGALMPAVLLLAACQQTPAILCATPPHILDIHAAFTPSRDDQMIDVTVQYRQAITAATLVMPDGTRTKAESVDTEADPSESTDRAFDAGNAPVTAGLDQPLSGAMTETTTVIGQVSSAAHIRVPDPADYAADWKKAHIVVRFGLGEDAFTQEIPAPTPPARTSE